MHRRAALVLLSTAYKNSYWPPGAVPESILDMCSASGADSSLASMYLAASAGAVSIHIQHFSHVGQRVLEGENLGMKPGCSDRSVRRRRPVESGGATVELSHTPIAKQQSPRGASRVATCEAERGLGTA